ncbi:kynurenine 3-monooxygenase cn [Lycorma delicatula]|uniref:kynurenine 3-monooxygenase cn n=1 Tax=Lycorma delicatula TaxID=130591 RepID=UPI003F51A5C7
MNSDTTSDRLNIALIGAGLVGSLAACFIGQRGHNVNVYEYRKDIRRTDLVKGKSINLALSTRGLIALKQVGLDLIIKDNSIPMKGRMIHKRDGQLTEILYDALENKCIHSVGRKFLNEKLITAAEKNKNVKFNFNHKLVHADLETNIMEFEIGESGERITVHADLIIGADGAHSAVRREMMKQPMFYFSQTYIEHGYIELCIPYNNQKEFAMPKNYLHIWPRNTFMMIALPNLDCTWTVSLFMPFKQFTILDSPEMVLRFFKKYFPDSIPLIGKEKLISDFFATKPSPLVSVKCNPFNKNGNCMIIGDAAHAMVPFYGQGMNAGFEDCYILDDLFSQFGNNLHVILNEFSKRRCQDASAICDLAMYNYIEMRDLVTRKSFLIRKKLDNTLYKFFPAVWLPLYNGVTFSTMRYSDCLKNKKWQDKVIKNSITLILLVLVMGISALLYKIKIALN